MNITLENDTILPKQIRLYRDGVYIAGIWYGGDDNDCKTEAEARESAELLKAFFEAKQAGKVARLVVDGEIPSHCCVLKGGNPNTCQFDGCPTKEAQPPKTA